MPKFSTGQAEQSDKLYQYSFAFSGPMRPADVLLRLVEACGYEVIYKALKKLKPKPAAPPASERPARAAADGRKAKSAASSKSY